MPPPFRCRGRLDHWMIGGFVSGLQQPPKKEGRPGFIMFLDCFRWFHSGSQLSLSVSPGRPLIKSCQDVVTDAIRPGRCHQHRLCRGVAQLHPLIGSLPIFNSWSRWSPLQTSLEPKSCGFAQWKNRTSKSSRAKQASRRNSSLEALVV